MKPLNDSVIIKDLTMDEITTPGGIIIKPSATPQRRRLGEVIAVGKGHRNIDGTYTKLTVDPGDKVIFDYANGNDIDFDKEGNHTTKEGEKVNVCKESHVVVVF